MSVFKSYNYTLSKPKKACGKGFILSGLKFTFPLLNLILWIGSLDNSFILSFSIT